ncbi:MAG: NFACT RNA binding domain-containing protein, partial [Nodularia sp. (in: cyanobacteria)]|nr:NFACT RNA binding domain-containing protein [Nodularia sp. (in: cyanobacteria)]
LLFDVQSEISYLEQVEAAVAMLAEGIAQIENYQTAADLQALEEIRDELIGQKYLEDPGYRSRSTSETAATNFHRYRTPNNFEVLIGRNNRQNDQLSFRVAGDYDLWFHAQEIPGSHLLLRLEPGTVPEAADLQFVANLAAYYSRARQSEQVPVVYTQPKHVYKPKGAKPGIAIYKQERILWGQPQLVISH